MIQTKLPVKVTPNASRNEIIGLVNGVWKFKIAAPPDRGKANKELLDFLKDELGIRKDDLNILKGQTTHNKLIAIRGLTQEEIIKRLSLHKHV